MFQLKLRNQPSAMRKSLWTVTCALNILPLTAILHNRIFFRSMCILNEFGSDYTRAVIMNWLTHDPSLPVAMALVIGLYFVGRKFAAVQVPALVFFFAFLPLSVWIWDIPFTNRVICQSFHDGRSVITSKVLYIFGPASWLAVVLFTRLKISSRRTAG